MKTTATAPSANAIGAPAIMKRSVTRGERQPEGEHDSAVISPFARLSSAHARVGRLDQELQREQRHADRHQRYGIQSGGAHDDEVVCLSTQASCRSVHDFHANRAQNASREIDGDQTTRRIGALRQERRHRLDADMAADRLHEGAAEEGRADQQKTAVSSCQSVDALNR